MPVLVTLSPHGFQQQLAFGTHALVSVEKIMCEDRRIVIQEMGTF